ncbi:MAG: hemerythrin domain-containing protein [Alistipes sp.]|nr:hemerythrin domain-containing protein [Alistipes sp.]
MNRPVVATLSPDMNIFELIDREPSVLSIFSRLNIGLPFGDMSIGDMCRRDGYSAELFLILCSMHADMGYRPAVGDLRADMLPEVIGYLRASHQYYASHMLPHASAHLEDILAHADSRSRRVLRSFYDDYTRYIVDHFQEEEEHIFAVINNATERCDADFSVIDTPHTDIDDRTNDIASLITKSLPEAVPTPLRCAMLKDIYALRDDLRRHNNIETHLLKPLVELYLKTERR